MKKLITLLTAVVFVTGCASTKHSDRTAATALNHGEFSSQALTTNSWSVSDNVGYVHAVRRNERCTDLNNTGSGRSRCH